MKNYWIETFATQTINFSSRVSEVREFVDFFNIEKENIEKYM